VTRVFVAAADSSEREAFAARIRGDGIAVAGTGASAGAIDVEVDVVLAASRDALDEQLETGVVVLSDALDASARDLAARRLPAWGVLPRGAAAADLRAALIAVGRGFVVVPASIAGGLDSRPAPATPDEHVAGESLTPREHEVLELASQGLSNREIAALLGITDHTVKFHLASIYGKLGAATRTEAVRRGLRRGLLTL
jgi:DNA-binding NarL/FixJ family response regulator